MLEKFGGWSSSLAEKDWNSKAGAPSHNQVINSSTRTRLLLEQLGVNDFAHLRCVFWIHLWATFCRQSLEYSELVKVSALGSVLLNFRLNPALFP